MAWKVLVWEDSGASTQISLMSGQVVSLGGPGQEADIAFAPLADRILFIECTPSSEVMIFSWEEGSTKQTSRIRLKVGDVAQAFALRFLLVKEDAPRPSLDETARPHTDDYARLLDWVQQPMSEANLLGLNLKEALRLTVEAVRAQAALLVLTEKQGTRLIALSGLQPDEATILWERMPNDLAERVVKSQARIILPEEMSRLAATTATVLVPTLGSLAGFPIMAERQVLGVVLLRFGNLFVELTEEHQRYLEHAAMILGLVLQRGMLREHLSEPLNRPSQDTSNRLMLGTSLAMEMVYKDISKLAPTTVPILIHGETGTGKELAAREIHRLSHRRSHPFVAINAAALPENLMESELFGYKRGAFSGAVADRIGLIEQAEGGTLFIDEIAELPLTAQAKLLRVLQEKTVQRLGDSKPRKVDFRLVTATHADLTECVQGKRFRDDLYFRIAGARIELPPLRQRKDDIPALATFFRKQAAASYGLSDKEWSHEAIQALLRAPWVGNVRELQNSVERALVVADGPVITAQDLGFPVDTSSEQEAEDMPSLKQSRRSLQRSKEEWLRTEVLEALHLTNWNKTAAAKHLGIGLRTLFRYIDQLGIDQEKSL